MKDKEYSELKRTLTLKRNTVPAVYGCYVSAEGEIISRFRRSLGLAGEEETEKYLAIFRRLLSGGRNKNLFEIPFSTRQVTDGEEHRLLMSLRKSEEPEDGDLGSLISKITATYKSEVSYCILFIRARYDVVKRSSADGDDEEKKSYEAFTYTACAICPVRQTKSDLAYDANEKLFCGLAPHSAVCMPEAGYFFPGFDNRQSNIYSAVFYTKSTDCDHGELTSALFGSGIGMTAAKQGATFRETLASTLDDNLTFDVARALHTSIADRIEEHKAARVDEPLVLTREDVRDCLAAAGIPDGELDSFSTMYNENFGAGEELEPKNIINPKKFELKTPDITIKVAPGKESLIAAKMINGKKYIIIDAEGGIELNGLDVKIPEE